MWSCIMKGIIFEKVQYTKKTPESYFGGWTNPSEKYDRQFGAFPQFVGMKIFKNIWKPPNQ